MDFNNITMLNDVDVKSYHNIIRVRIISWWKLPSKNNADETYSIEMIVVDEQGTRMHASCLSKYFSLFEKYFTHGSCLIIKSPTFGPNTATFKYVDNRHKIGFYYNTKITQSDDLFGSFYGFSFTGFKSILDKTAREDVSIDVIGSVVRCFDRVKKAGDNNYYRRSMELEDLENHCICVTLWDEYEKQFSDYLSKHPDVTTIVIVLQFGRLKWFGGKPYVSNAFNNVTRLFINDDINEINSFKQSLLERPEKETSSSSRRTTSSLIYSLRDEFLVNNDFCKVAELLEIMEVKSVIIVATIIHVDPHIEWYYDACTKCNKKVNKEVIRTMEDEGSADFEEKKVLTCKTPKCAGEAISATQRFKLPIQVQDPTGITSFTIFDGEARRIFKKTAKEILEKYLEVCYNKSLPDEFDDLVDKKYGFKIDITNYNVINKCQFFTISKMTNDSSIIGELEKNFNLEEDDSWTADNVTPIFKLNEIESISKADKVKLKCSLDEIYDVDEPLSYSSTKARQSLSSSGKEDNFKLLTPKLEK
ncbi:hypothetical protein E3N88_02892 [Mikania micrantha]|uniref:Replication factor A C-terminal domain-containing protein n=1 Tax=Mikania micrantha TaxID=192012 RepID=A0A5N6Q6V7_9ASTR|nr:hypothetical protein E3N88_02892 [Mikania micrantha]